MEVTTKPCTKCGNIYKIDDFPKDGKDRLGNQKYSAQCRGCLNEYKIQRKTSKLPQLTIPNPYLSDGVNKLCNKCKVIKTIDNFSILNVKKDNLNPTCKECMKLYMGKWYTTIDKIIVDDKPCIRCNHTKPIDDFPKNKLSKDNYSDYCKKCTSDMQSIILNNDPDLDGDSTCLKCGEIKPKTEFPLKNTRKEGIHQWCRECVKEAFNKNNKRVLQERLKREENHKLIHGDSIPMVVEKECKVCKQTKDINRFNIENYSIDGYSHKCKECTNISRGDYISLNPTHHQKYWSNYYLKNKENRIQRWDVSIQEKKCASCQQIKPVDNFVKHYWNSDGLGSNCFDCRQIYNKKWHQQNPDYGKQYYIENKEICDLKWKEYYKINREKLIHDKLKYKDLYKEIDQKRRIRKRMSELQERIKNGLGSGDSMVYFIKFSNNLENEEFYKIGVTTRNVKERFKHTHYKDYNIEIILEKYYDRGDAYCVESLLIKKHREMGLQYIPKNKFPGYTECFVDLNLEVINSIHD